LNFNFSLKIQLSKNPKSNFQKGPARSVLKTFGKFHCTLRNKISSGKVALCCVKRKGNCKGTKNVSKLNLKNYTRFSVEKRWRKRGKKRDVGRGKKRDVGRGKKRDGGRGKKRWRKRERRETEERGKKRKGGREGRREGASEGRREREEEKEGKNMEDTMNAATTNPNGASTYSASRPLFTALF
jgi:hypothetical protein